MVDAEVPGGAEQVAHDDHVSGGVGTVIPRPFRRQNYHAQLMISQ